MCSATKKCIKDIKVIKFLKGLKLAFEGRRPAQMHLPHLLILEEAIATMSHE
jgi:hypothetical protein